ncbi:MAG: prepilin-type N-terminal cleavage/methylation domain-containing protein [Phycisphaerales bacterium]
MRRMAHKGFTLVEILIVVVILGILAAIVIPQFANASNDALKGTLQTQLQTISSQVELYRVRNVGNYPANITTAANNNGWAELIDEGYLKEEPRNGYTGSTLLVDGVEADAIAQTSASANGWYFDLSSGTLTVGQVWAAGYDADANTLEHE